MFVRWLLSLDSWHNILLLLGSWLQSNILFIVSQLMKLRSSECKSLIQIILIINSSFEKFQKQVGPRVRIGFRCNSYETPLSSRNIDVAIPEIFISSGREWTIHFFFRVVGQIGAGNCFLGNVRSWMTQAVKIKPDREWLMNRAICKKGTGILFTSNNNKWQTKWRKLGQNTLKIGTCRDLVYDL